MYKVNQLPDDQKNNKDIQKLLECIKEENLIFGLMTDKFEWLMSEFEQITLKLE